ncbi:hypothetical protein PC121_g22840 [Phytophthora cactorum]|nr:hypothetical protein PC120_g24849 [Phytophthora cactorum]KAG3042969.1 hypothetical protein PC121_g22840 [Phytophthora cactorum]KAG4047561.1 hypothetical protein PC123_g17086 [Phytophthora cactorum]
MHPLARRAPNNTAEDLHLTRVAKDAGADAYLVVCPYVTTSLFKRAAHPLQVIRHRTHQGSSGSLNQPMEIAALCGGTIVLTTTTWLCRSWPWQLRTPSACSPTPRAVSPQEVLVVTDLMLTGDYDGARKAALAPSWSSRLSSGHPVAHHEDAPAHRHVAWLLCLRH